MAVPPWMVTAYVPGPSLQQAVRDHGLMPARTVFQLMAGVAEALQAIHSAGVVHRDLKPSNVLLAPDGPRVIDFGIARAADATALTRTGMRVGSPQFMAPEQIAGHSATPATDIFGLGALAAYAALGRAPFGNAVRLMYAGAASAVVHPAPTSPPCADRLVRPQGRRGTDRSARTTQESSATQALSGRFASRAIGDLYVRGTGWPWRPVSALSRR